MGPWISALRDGLPAPSISLLAALGLLALLAYKGWSSHEQENISELSGPTHEQRLLGARNIGTTSPVNLEAILDTQRKDFNLGFRIPQFRDLMGTGVFTQEGKGWSHSRQLLRPLFASNRFQAFEDIRRCVEDMLDNITPNTVVDLHPRIFQLTLATTLFMLFGDSAHRMISAADKEEQNLASAFNDAQEYLAYRTRVGPFHWLINGPPMWRACKTIHSFLDRAIEEALAVSDERLIQQSKYKRYVFIDELIQQTRDPVVLRDQCMSLLLAGRDSTAACLSWTMRLLGRHQRVLTKVRDEIASIVGLGPDARQPTQDELKEMTYLNLAIKESLRLYPPVPVNQRAASYDTTIPEGGGPDGLSPVLVRQGESVGYSVYAMHRRTDIYGPDALEYRPERWQNEGLQGIGLGYLPFGAGARKCLGQEFAMLETRYTIARMIQRFPFITVPDGETLEIGKEKQLLTLVVTSAEGCRLRLS
ncbi:unnamed protein product [Alternaria alternata]